MADHFLTKSRIDLIRCIHLGDTIAMDNHAELHRILTERASPEAARLFAEPLVSRGNDQAAPTVSWYSDYPGHGVPMYRLDEASRGQIEAALHDRLAPLDALIDDAEAGPLISAALYIHSDEDIWAVDGVPVLINWGMLPDGAGTGARARLAHYRATLGRFLPLDAAPPLDEKERTRFTEDRNRRAATAAAATVAAAGATAATASPGAASETVSSAASGTADDGTVPPAEGRRKAVRQRSPPESPIACRLSRGCHWSCCCLWQVDSSHG